MPLIEIPHYDKLPEELYGGALKRCNPYDLYMYYRGNWCVDSKHILGWSREIHLVHDMGLHCPKTFVGDLFIRVDDELEQHKGANRNVYYLFGTFDKYTFENIFLMAAEAINKLEQSDRHEDAWGCRSLQQWHQEFHNIWRESTLTEPSEQLHIQIRQRSI